MHFLALAYLTIMQLSYDVRVNSAYRTPDYNRTVGGKEGSKHTLGKAYDLATHHFDKQTKNRFIKDARRLFDVVVIYPTHIHVHID